MEFYERFIEIVDTNLIYCLIPIILTLVIVELIFKNRFETKKTLNLIRWVIIIYSVITWTFYFVEMVLHPEEYTFNNRSTGHYAIAYWTMFLSVLILPFLLLIKKIGTKFWCVLVVAFCMKIGSYFERFVIITTSLHRDYLTENENSEFINSFLFGVAMQFLQGIIITILTLGIFEIIKKKILRNIGLAI
jgi:hypothetical protein